MAQYASNEVFKISAGAIAQIATVAGESTASQLKGKVMARIYRVATVEAQGEDDVAPIVHIHVRWASSEGDAKKARRELCDKFELKLAEVTYELIEFPTDKAGLIAWLNEHHVTEAEPAA